MLAEAAGRLAHAHEWVHQTVDAVADQLTFRLQVGGPQVIHTGIAGRGTDSAWGKIIGRSSRHRFHPCRYRRPIGGQTQAPSQCRPPNPNDASRPAHPRTVLEVPRIRVSSIAQQAPNTARRPVPALSCDPAGTSPKVAGHLIPGGMVYVGSDAPR
jgi:hypothetical protein